MVRIGFGILMQNSMPITVLLSKLKPEVEFQYGGDLLMETGNSYISATDWDIATKFGLLIASDIVKRPTSPNPKVETGRKIAP